MVIGGAVTWLVLGRRSGGAIRLVDFRRCVAGLLTAAQLQ